MQVINPIYWAEEKQIELCEKDAQGRELILNHLESNRYNFCRLCSNLSEASYWNRFANTISMDEISRTNWGSK